MGIPATLSSVPAQTPYVQYVATSGQTVFPYPFTITQDSDLVCVINGVTQATDSGYSLSGQGNPTGGNLTFTTGQTAGNIVTLYRDVAIQRITQIAQNSGFSSTAFNAEFNNIYLLLQQLDELITYQCLSIPVTNEQSGAGTILTPGLYANKYLAFDSNGNPEPALLTSSGTLTLSILAGLLNPQTAAETSIGVTAVNLQYPPGYADRYATNTTPGTTDMTSAIQNALNVAAVIGGNSGVATLLANTYLVSSTITIPACTTLKGTAPNTGTAASTNGTNVYCNTASTTVFQLGNSDTGLTFFPKISDLGVTFGSSAAGGTAFLFRCAAYGSVINCYTYTAAAIAYTGITFRGGSSGSVSCFGNLVLGGFIQNCHVGVEFTNLGSTYGTNQTIVNLSLSARSGDASSIAYYFVNADDGMGTNITGGFVQSFVYGVHFSTTPAVTFNGVAFYSNTTDIVWSGADTNCLFVGATDVTGTVSTSGTMGPTNGIINGGNVNGVVINSGKSNDPTTSVAVGASALGDTTATSLDATAIGVDALASLTSGVQNTAVGAAAADAVTTGHNLTAIGYSAQPSSATATNEITLGNSSVATLRCEVTSITGISDARDKTAVKVLPWGLDFVNALKPVAFTWNRRDKSKVGVPGHGFIAQDLQAVQTQYGAESLRLVMDANPERLEATYGHLLPVLVKAVQELSAEVTALKAQLAAK